MRYPQKEHPFFFFLILTLLITCFACANEDQEVKLEYLISYNNTGSIDRVQLTQYWGNNEAANSFINYDVDIYSVEYKSTDLSGGVISLSGAILIPKTAMAEGIVSLQHATFFDDNEAPSVNQGFSVVSRKSIFASNGHVVFLPDYHGYGIDRDRIHPYHHAASLATASSDFIRAGRELLSVLEVAYENKLFLAGYSEGAYATAALQQKLENDGVRITASSLGAGSYNIKETVEMFLSRKDEGDNCSPCNAFFLQSYNATYDLGHPMTYFFKDPYAGLIKDGLLLGGFSGVAANGSLPANPSALFADQFILDYLPNEGIWSDMLKENSVHKWIPQNPVLLTHGKNDNVSPYFNSENLASLNAQNQNVTFMELDYDDHFEGIFTWGILSMNYFNSY